MKIISKANRRNPTYYPAVGKCIYCNCTDQDLTDEHIVAQSLGGLHILREASCKRCQKIIHKFETSAIDQDHISGFRTHENFPTKRPKKRKSKFAIRDPANAEKRILVPLASYPKYVVLPKFPQPNILIGKPPSRDFTFEIQEIYDPKSIDKKIADQFPNGKVLLDVKISAQSFMLMLAKIGHAAAYAELGPDHFVPLLPNFILGKDLTLGSYLVGQTEFNAPKIEDSFCNWVYVFTYRNGIWLLLIYVQLFASVPSPTYCVVAGQMVLSEKLFAKIGHRLNLDGTRELFVATEACS